ncbi:hypothetical protein SRRS_11820 [Sporomusa rhizae]|uniref:hypothetical protein n=1 Tax=Sporomusa rhizae TaxID=357999 RepID=UPI00352A078E
MDMNVFGKDNWNQSSLGDKKQALQNLENHYAAQQGRNPIILQFTKLDDAGSFNPISNTLKINNEILVSGDSGKRYQVIDTVIHEGRHAYQSYAIEHPGKHPNKIEEEKWRENDLGYIKADPQNLYKYRFQALERDAYDYTTSEMGNIFKAMPGEEGIYIQYEQIMEDYTKGFQLAAESALGKDYLQKIDAEVAEKARMLRELQNKDKNVARIINTPHPSSTKEEVATNAITYDKLKIESPWEIQSIYDLTITKTLNQHAKLEITALLTEEGGKKAGQQETPDDIVKLYTEETSDGKTEKKYLFKGRLNQVGIHQDGGLYVLSATFLSHSSVLDSQEKSRSFQDTSLTYNDIVSKIMADYSGKSIELTADKTQINGPLIQYQETDWQFIKRIASYQEAVIVPDVTLDEIVFSFGYPAGGVKTLPENINYKSGKDIAAYNRDWTYNPDLIANEYTYFEVESYQELTIGDKVTFQGYELYVSAVTIRLKNSILTFHAKLVRQMTIRQNPIYNEKIQGVSLEGKVLALQNQEIKLHLQIDQEQDEGTAYWYPFVPPTTDMMYLMPQLNTNASLYIPGLKEQNAIIKGNLRSNGGTCERTGDPNTRYLGTEYGQELKIAPGGVYITAGLSNLVANFDDNEGVKLSSHKEMKLEAEQEIIIKSQNTVSLNGASQVLIATPTAAISLENETHFRAAQTHIDCTDEAPLPEVEQPEQKEEKAAEQKQENKQESSVNWAALAVGVAAGIAVCIVAAPYIAAGVAMAGLTTGFAAAATGAAFGAISAAVGTIAGMSTVALQEGKTADLGEMVEAAVKAAIVGAITGAIFGPLLAVASKWTPTWPYVGLSGLGGAFSSGLNDVLFNDGNIDYKNMGLATALGLFGGGITKPGRAGAAAKNVGSGKARYGERKISDKEYNELRQKTPTKELQDKVNEGVQLPMDDPALPGKTITNRLEPDHIVSYEKITRMDGFEKLTPEQRLKVINNQDNIEGLSRSANGSKQDKSYEEWTHYKKGKPDEIEVDPAFRKRMMEKEKDLEGKLQNQIDDFNKQNE